MKITCDPVKRAITLAERGLDFEDAAEVFRGDTLDFPDDRRDYGELRMLTVGHLRGRMVIVILDAARKCPARYLDEESKCPRKNALWEAI
jgi:uncharacterized DUF497 family protein